MENSVVRIYLGKEIVLTKSGRRWTIEECSLCGAGHLKVQGFLDDKGVEYAYCINRFIESTNTFEAVAIKDSEWVEDHEPVWTDEQKRRYMIDDL